jgi:hypothetical protein
LRNTNYTEGETLNASCVAKYVYTAPRIVWKLGDRVLRNDTGDGNVDEASTHVVSWAWPWSTKYVKQVMNQTVLTLEDNLKNLTCQASYPAMSDETADEIISLTNIIVNVHQGNYALEFHSEPHCTKTLYVSSTMYIH